MTPGLGVVVHGMPRSVGLRALANAHVPALPALPRPAKGIHRKSSGAVLGQVLACSTGAFLALRYARGASDARHIRVVTKCEASVGASVVPLTSQRTQPSTKCEPRNCAVVLVHGLDSWRGTWRRTADELAQRGIASLAVDLRGHGESPLGTESDFGPKQLAADVRAAVRSAGLLANGSRILLVGHSMGGRIAMRYAADYPEDLAAVIIEDMDCVPRQYKSPADEELERRRQFTREFSCWEDCRKELLTYGYDEKRVDGWLLEMPPRVFRKGEGSSVWSAINPHAQYLARKTVLNSTDGLEALQEIAKVRACGRDDLAVHVFVAGPQGTVCSWDKLPGGVHDMGAIAPGLQTREFPEAGHSIHNTGQDFADAVEEIIAACGC